MLEDVALHRDVDPLYPSFASKGPPTAEDEAGVMLWRGRTPAAHRVPPALRSPLPTAAGEGRRRRTRGSRSPTPRLLGPARLPAAGSGP